MAMARPTPSAQGPGGKLSGAPRTGAPKTGPPLTGTKEGHNFAYMLARWASFTVGLWLLLAPLVLGYPTVRAVLHDVALGTLVSTAALAALEWPLARFALALLAAWLLTAANALGWSSRTVIANELAAGVALLLLSLVPSGKVAVTRRPAKVAV